MGQVKIKSGFRFGGKYYPPSEEQVQLPEGAAKFAINSGCGFAIEAEAGEAEEIAAKAKSKEAESNKNKENAPENK